MIKRNMDIRTMAKNSGVFLWEIAEWLEVSEQTFIRKLRKELSDEDKLKVFDAIGKIEREHRLGRSVSKTLK